MQDDPFTVGEFTSENGFLCRPIKQIKNGPWLLLWEVVLLLLVLPGLRPYAMGDILSLSVFPRSDDKNTDFH